MIRRMADRLGHLGHQKSLSDSPNRPLTFPSSSSHAPLGIIDKRGSISTQRTSLSDFTRRTNSLSTGEGATPLMLAQQRVTRQKGTYRLTDFIIHRTLGTGSFGRVHLVQSKHNLRFYAIKVLSKERVVKMKQVEHTNNERHLLSAVQHPFIINLWGTFQDASNLYMVMDFIHGGELFTLLRRSNRFPDPVAKFYAAEVALALHYLHGLDIVYRDLKPENILLNHDGHIKVTDFGFAKECVNTTWTLCGTPDYLAPEVISQQRYNKSVDWYALGVLIYEMLSGFPPFHQPDGNHAALYEKILRGPSFMRWPTAFSDSATDLIMKLMESDPSKRYGNLKNGSMDVFHHEWFKEVNWDMLLNRQITAPYVPNISGEGDASAFEFYPEDNVASTYGLTLPDPHGQDFPEFEYTSES
ncbi:hypothetical protein AX17_007119 [Amanita inopinata Kibby_2008]|nr:hypothetical protein AX17_007119 [Amanita inopinata Kibby_2008]